MATSIKKISVKAYHGRRCRFYFDSALIFSTKETFSQIMQANVKPEKQKQNLSLLNFEDF